jgi:hypothetical protein
LCTEANGGSLSGGRPGAGEHPPLSSKQARRLPRTDPALVAAERCGCRPRRPGSPVPPPTPPCSSPATAEILVFGCQRRRAWSEMEVVWSQQSSSPLFSPTSATNPRPPQAEMARWYRAVIVAVTSSVAQAQRTSECQAHVGSGGGRAQDAA